MTQQNSQKISNTEYDDLLSKSFKNTNVKEKSIISGLSES